MQSHHLQPFEAPQVQDSQNFLDGLVQSLTWDD